MPTVYPTTLSRTKSILEGVIKLFRDFVPARMTLVFILLGHGNQIMDMMVFQSRIRLVLDVSHTTMWLCG